MFFFPPLLPLTSPSTQDGGVGGVKCDDVCFFPSQNGRYPSIRSLSRPLRASGPGALSLSFSPLLGGETRAAPSGC
ncbi:hypothetical protein V8C43DRAFT_282056 [Trichoderma afarasin]